MNITVKALCKQASVSRSGYYSWLKNSGKEHKDIQDYKQIKSIFKRKKEKAGWRVINMELESIGITMNHKKIRRIMKKYNLITKVRRRNPYKYIAKATKEHKIKKNILKRKFKQD
ncbi:MAG: IS3 family transposase, partial [Romboutsia sp.]|uniref:IS3 family transposase n=1 Tax=Romboutsia sp. TaxID=1965302 RepID=UPI003F34A306